MAKRQQTIQRAKVKRKVAQAANRAAKLEKREGRSARRSQVSAPPSGEQA
ncbi:MAG TPA: hypothetical protein VFQ38_07095 [Longimicrobiales bacterium]|nr:hypothetical protein [Longimicrobiales bacterium]